MREDGRLVVQISFPPPRPPINPYTALLTDAIRRQPGVEVLDFSYRSALTSRYDVFHVHWPEILVTGHSRLKKLVRQGLFVLLLMRLWLWGIPLVRTAHNIGLPEGISWRERLLLRWAERLTSVWIVLNPATPVPSRAGCLLIPHGHLKPWFDGYEVPPPVPGRVGYFGRIRRYKGVEQLVEAFRATVHAQPQGQLNDGGEVGVGPLSLMIAGHPSTPELARDLQQRSADDPRISLELGFLEDHDIVRVVGQSELVVLPYPRMHNSGAALTALSIGRPILVPANPVNDALAREVGPGWVFTFSGVLTPESILAALGDLRRKPPQLPPDLSARGWDEAGREHVAAYRLALRDGEGRARAWTQRQVQHNA